MIQEKKIKKLLLINFYQKIIKMSDLEKIKKLRQSTGAGFKDCSSAIKRSSWRS